MMPPFQSTTLAILDTRICFKQAEHAIEIHRRVEDVSYIVNRWPEVVGCRRDISRLEVRGGSEFVRRALSWRGRADYFSGPLLPKINIRQNHCDTFEIPLLCDTHHVNSDKMPTRLSKTRKHRGHVSAGRGRVGKQYVDNELHTYWRPSC
jgi:hypothetical protein